MVKQDLSAMVDQIVETVQVNLAAAVGWLDEISVLMADIAANALCKFRSSREQSALYFALVTLVGQDWIPEGSARRNFGKKT